ncbi:MAG: hypothetical protein H6855_00800 [Rhodospirillales bacterium]|nr:hypothetical protein [Rhodospirillales bacterium]MCB9964607.1 hypothetical protein [Rhodospirillales bacterium]
MTYKDLDGGLYFRGQKTFTTGRPADDRKTVTLANAAFFLTGGDLLINSRTGESEIYYCGMLASQETEETVWISHATLQTLITQSPKDVVPLGDKDIGDKTPAAILEEVQALIAGLFPEDDPAAADPDFDTAFNDNTPDYSR